MRKIEKELDGNIKQKDDEVKQSNRRRQVSQDDDLFKIPFTPLPNPKANLPYETPRNLHKSLSEELPNFSSPNMSFPNNHSILSNRDIQPEVSHFFHPAANTNRELFHPSGSKPSSTFQPEDPEEILLIDNVDSQTSKMTLDENNYNTEQSFLAKGHQENSNF